MKYLTVFALVAIALLGACAGSSPLVAHAHFDGKGDVHFDGAILAVKGTGNAEVGITFKGGIPFYPPTGLMVFEGDYAEGIDLWAKDDPTTTDFDERRIGYEAAITRLGVAHAADPPKPPE